MDYEDGAVEGQQRTQERRKKIQGFLKEETDRAIYVKDDPKNREELKPQDEEPTPAIQTNGIDLAAIWQLQDVLETRYFYSKDIHAMLIKYGVKAARETIMRLYDLVQGIPPDEQALRDHGVGFAH
ncbi:hypothetical protein CRG98_001437 [Punica granatum]|uniref:Uncharacterized protein n=1 Tax=Punica granatum TaxID=22663 RepID=A0A2I0LBQ2_PUNGR|nr:hypothetical protein CRG98_001437 [Punica granatum]